MPPKREYKSSDILNAALQVVREEGFDKLSTRTIAQRLHSSTMPIYYSGITMPDIEKAIGTKAWELLEEYQKKARTGDPVIDGIVGAVMFAKEERNLYQCFRNKKLNDVNIVNAGKNFQIGLEIIQGHDILKKLTPEQAVDVLVKCWIIANGIALLLNSPLRKIIPILDSDESIIKFIKETAKTYAIGVESILKKNEEKARAIDPSAIVIDEITK